MIQRNPAEPKRRPDFKAKPMVAKTIPVKLTAGFLHSEKSATSAYIAQTSAMVGA